MARGSGADRRTAPGSALGGASARWCDVVEERDPRAAECADAMGSPLCGNGGVRARCATAAGHGCGFVRDGRDASLLSRKKPAEQVALPFLLFLLFKSLTSLTSPTSGAETADRAGNPANKSDNPAMSLARFEVMVHCSVERSRIRNEISRRTIAGRCRCGQTP
jgi:hypothetical protein